MTFHLWMVVLATRHQNIFHHSELQQLQNSAATFMSELYIYQSFKCLRCVCLPSATFITVTV